MAMNPACRCGRICVGMVVTEHRNWNPDCPEHGTESEWWLSRGQSLRSHDDTPPDASVMAKVMRWSEYPRLMAERRGLIGPDETRSKDVTTTDRPMPLDLQKQVYEAITIINTAEGTWATMSPEDRYAIGIKERFVVLALMDAGWQPPGVPGDWVTGDEMLDEITDNWPDTNDGWFTYADRYEVTKAVLERVPDGMAKLDGEWVRIESTPSGLEGIPGPYFRRARWR